MNQIKNIYSSIKDVYSSKQYFLMTSAFAFFMLAANAALLNYQLIKNQFSLPLLFALMAGLPKSMEVSSFISLTVIAFLGGIVFSLSVYLIRRQLSANISSGASGVGIIAGLLAPSCPSCALGILSTLGIGGSLAVLPFKGLEFGFFGILVLLASLAYLSRKIATKTCEMNLEKL